MGETIHTCCVEVGGGTGGHRCCVEKKEHQTPLGGSPTEHTMRGGDLDTGYQSVENRCRSGERSARARGKCTRSRIEVIVSRVGDSGSARNQGRGSAKEGEYRSRRKRVLSGTKPTDIPRKQLLSAGKIK